MSFNLVVRVSPKLLSLGETWVETWIDAVIINTINDLTLFSNPQVVGVALNGIQHEGDVDEAIKKLETINDKKFKTIFSMLYDLNQSLNLFQRYEVTSIFECRILSVDNSYRGRGMANEMFKLSIDVAAKAGFKVSRSKPSWQKIDSFVALLSSCRWVHRKIRPGWE